MHVGVWTVVVFYVFASCVNGNCVRYIVSKTLLLL